MAAENNNAPPPNQPNELDVRRVTGHLLATVMAGRGRLKAARTVRDHVHLALTLANTERKAASILFRGATLTRKPAPRSEAEDIEVDMNG